MNVRKIKLNVQVRHPKLSGADLFNWIFTGAQFALLLQVRNGRVKGAAFISSVYAFILVKIQVHETRVSWGVGYARSQFGLLIRSGPTFGQQLARFPLFRK